MNELPERKLNRIRYRIMKGDIFMKKDNQITDELAATISGGLKLPLGWKNIADSLAPQYKEKYPDTTYEEACIMLQEYFPDPDDYAKITDYIQKFF